MLLIQLDKNRKSGYLYQQVYEKIKQLILDRKLAENEKLPSKRDLATNLKVSVNTITFAYEQLLAEGYIYTIERSGYYVEKITKFKHLGPTTHQLPADLKEEMLDKEPGWLSLSHMATEASLFPFKEWRKYEQLAIENHADEFAHITHLQGPYEVRKSIARLIQLTRGVVCEPEQIVIGIGTQSLINQVVQLQSDDAIPKVAVEDPGYGRVYRLLQKGRVPVTAIPVDDKGIQMKQMTAADPDLVLVTPSHQFPLGTIMPISRRIQLLNWAMQKENRYILEDDYDSEFKYETDNIPSLQSLDYHQRVIYFGTFSKSLLTGLRISYMVLPIPLLRKYRTRFADLIPYNNTLNLYTLHYFIKSGAYVRHIKRMNIHYEKKRQLLISALEETFQDQVTVQNIPAGLHFVAAFQTNKTYADVEHISKVLKLEVYTIRRFTLQQETTKADTIQLVIGFAAIAEADITEAVTRLFKIINDPFISREIP